MCDNLYNSLNYNNSISDLKEVEKNELVNLIEKLDSESLETIYTLILYDYSKNFPNSKVIFPYKSKQNDNNIEIKLDGLPIRLKRIIYKFVKIASLKDADSFTTQLTTKITENNSDISKDKVLNKSKNKNSTIQVKNNECNNITSVEIKEDSNNSTNKSEKNKPIKSTKNKSSEIKKDVNNKSGKNVDNKSEKNNKVEIKSAKNKADSTKSVKNKTKTKK